MIAEGKKADRRKNERFPLPGGKAAYKRSGLFAFLGNGIKTNGALVNLGAGGAQFITDEYVQPNTGLVLEIDVPAFVGGMCFKAETVWAKKIPEKKAYRIGVKFLKCDKETAHRLDTLRKDVFFRTTKNQVGKPNKLKVG